MSSDIDMIGRRQTDKQSLATAIPPLAWVGAGGRTIWERGEGNPFFSMNFN